MPPSASRVPASYNETLTYMVLPLSPRCLAESQLGIVLSEIQLSEKELTAMASLVPFA